MARSAPLTLEGELVHLWRGAYWQVAAGVDQGNRPRGGPGNWDSRRHPRRAAAHPSERAVAALGQRISVQRHSRPEHPGASGPPNS
eukprot:CAMPEP_0181173032 /NCGR_PEP_ID=MMETSP1096-20121128/2771_1 /TAXON_ID=156174 ORGANISM="Chrysochromulina ericina, Strain CCMP281" /NCGR_SAMPLE_ID=MMETSP1096 /ASSEMBLY_ACC=CAM_ASM_000453 /LENGTH=85 /DNA_ID=CAMNT_0023260809 /DNA_START=178 /DNA_END=436 /DNA_ORIENTATION=-